jgi:lipopolysaccharide export LptBFGC system permease protein LptF
MLIKKLHQYIVKEFLSSFIFGSIIFSSLLIFERVFALVNLFISKKVNLIIILKLFCFLLPNILVITIPMAVLFGALLAYSKLSENNEIMALKSLGTNYITLFLPTVLMVFFISLTMLFVNHIITPLSHAKFKSLYKTVAISTSCINLNDKKAIKLGSYMLYADSVNKKKNIMYRVSIYNPTYDNKIRITASLANIYIGKNSVIKLILHNGYLQKVDTAHNDSITLIYFNYYYFTIDLYELLKKHIKTISIYEMSSYDIYKKIQYCKQKNMDTIEYEQQFWFRWIFAVAPLAFTICALPLGIIINKSNKNIGFIISLCIIVLYYVMLIITISLSEKHYLPTNISMWLPNIIVAIIGIFFLVKVVTI